ncbi:MAG TPA: hypothetical protein VFS97_11665 [Nitrososphaeraceae archaeon]|nr:hypothetical protein [Nitrososphaeraceae archaeon]
MIRVVHVADMTVRGGPVKDTGPTVDRKLGVVVNNIVVQAEAGN